MTVILKRRKAWASPLCVYFPRNEIDPQINPISRPRTITCGILSQVWKSQAVRATVGDMYSPVILAPVTLTKATIRKYRPDYYVTLEVP